MRRHDAFARRPGRGALALLATVVLIASAVAVLAPRALHSVTTGELRAALGELAPERRDPVAALTVRDPFGAAEAGTPSRFDPPIAAVYGALEQALESVRADQRPPLRDALGPAEFVALGADSSVVSPNAEPDDPAFFVRTALDPLLEQRVRIVGGRVAEPAVIPVGLPGDSLNDIPIELTMSVDTAQAMRWQLGEQRQAGARLVFVLVGVFEAVDPGASYWARVMSVLEPELFDDGNTQPRVTATVYLNPLSVEAMAVRSMLVWYPLAPDSVSAAEIDALAPQLRQFTAAPIPLPLAGAPGTTARFTSDAVTVIDAVLGRSAVTTAVLAMIASGPIGVLLTVLALAALTVVERRRSVLALLSARGASGLQVRGSVSLAGLAAGIPASLGGLAIAISLVPGAVMIADMGVALALGLAPAVLLAALAGPSSLCARRGDLDVRGLRAGPRRIVEVLVVALAVASVALVLQRGVTTTAATVGVDPLLVAMPLLSTLAVCVIALRLYPLGMALVLRMLRERGSVVAVIGATRSLREPAGTLTTVLALAVAVSVSVFSLGMLSSLDRAIEQSARDTVGAELRVGGFGIGSGAEVHALAEAVSALPGVGAVATVGDAGPVVASVGDVRIIATLFVVDERISPLRTDLPADWPASATPEGDDVRVVVSADLIVGLADGGAGLVVGPQAVEVAAVGRVGSGYGVPGPWVLVARADAERLTSRSTAPTLVLIDSAPGGDRGEIARAVEALAPSDARLSTIDAARAAILAVPTTAALRIALQASLALVGALALTALALTIIIEAPTRRRLGVILRVLGARPGAALAGWQVVPPALVAGAVGLAWGAALPSVVLAAVDLRAFTGSDDAPAASIDPLLTAALLAALALGVAVTIALAARAERRSDLTRTLRTETS